LAARAVFCVCQKIASRPFDLGEDKLGARLPGPVENEIDRRPTSAADDDKRLVDDFCVFRPSFFEAVAVDARGRRPRRPRLQHEAVLEGQPNEVGQPAIWLRVPRDKKDAGAVGFAAHAATAYSWISPPSTSRRRTAGGGEPRAAGGWPAGVASASERCGRAPL
jgi:hypothetical protein